MLKNTTSSFGKKTYLMIKLKTKAIEKFVKGPAMATFKAPHFWSLKFKGLIGTGFAQPKIGPLPKVAANKIKGSKIVPKGSMCFKGFKLNLPISRAVLSPKDKATLPWAISWMTIEVNKTIKVKTVIIILYHITT